MNKHDALKGVFVLLVHPVITEITSITARFSCRSLKHNHPSTSFQFISVVVVVKKVFTRFVVAAIKSTGLVLFITFFNAILEFLVRYTMPIRDRALYRALFKKFLPLDKNPCALMSDARNRGLRAETENLEALTDLVFITTMLFWPLFMKTAACNRTECKLVTLEGTWLNQFLQYVIENGIDVVIIVAMSIGQNYHVTQQSKVKCPYWTFLVAIHVIWGLNVFFDWPITLLYCHSKTWTTDYFAAFCVAEPINMNLI